MKFVFKALHYFRMILCYFIGHSRVINNNKCFRCGKSLAWGVDNGYEIDYNLD